MNKLDRMNRGRRTARHLGRVAGLMAAGVMLGAVIGNFEGIKNMIENVETVGAVRQDAGSYGIEQLSELTDLSAHFCANFGQLETILRTSPVGVELVEVYSADQGRVFWEVLDVDGDCSIHTDVETAIWDFDIKLERAYAKGAE